MRPAASPRRWRSPTAPGPCWAARVLRADGSLGSPLPAGSGQADVRDVQVAVTDRGELVVVWAALVNRSNGGSAVRYAVAAPGRSFSGARTLAAVGSNTGATPRMAALRGGTVAVIFRDTRPPRTGGVLRYARRAPHGSFGTARSLGRDGVGPEIQASPGGGALLAWGAGSADATGARDRLGPARGAPSRAGHLRRRQRSLDHAHGVRRRHGVGHLDAARQPEGRPASLGAPARATAPRSDRSNRSGRWPTASRASRSARPGSALATWNARGPGAVAERRAGVGAGRRRGTRRARASSTRAASARPRRPPRWLRTTPLVLFTRQIASTSGVQAQAVAADPATGEAPPCSPTPGASPRPRSRTAATALRRGLGRAGRRHRGQHRSLTGGAAPVMLHA